MKSKLKMSAAAVAVALSATAASAVPVVYDVMPTNPLPTGNAFQANIEALFGGAANVGFGLVNKVEVTQDTTQDPPFTLFGEESAFVNDFIFRIGGVDVITVGEGACCDGGDTKDLTAGVYTGDDMEFMSNLGTNASLGDVGFGIYYDLLGHSEYVLLAFADREAKFDSDYDDLIIKTKGNINVVPLPAAGWMLIAGLGGIAAMKRRKKAA